MKNIKRAFAVAAIAAALGGTVLHFLYQWLPNPLTALLAPVNESVWEHLKLLIYPTLIAAFVLSHRMREKNRYWGGFFAAVLLMPLFLLGAYYLLRMFGISGLAVDIALYYVTMFLGFALAYLLIRRGTAERFAGFLLMLVILYGASLILFTFAAPALPMFTPPAR